MTLIQLDVKRGNVNDIVNDSVRSSYQVSHLKQTQLAVNVIILPIQVLGWTLSFAGTMAVLKCKMNDAGF